MTDKQIYDLYVLQSKNVRRLKQVQKSIIKDINFYLRKNDSFQVEIKTKLLALLHCTLSEAEFIQIVHTPQGFRSTEIEQIKAAKNSNIETGWKTMVDIAMDKVGSWKTNSDLKSRRDYLHSIIDEFIVNPSLLRNKIAHGQWEYALNRENTSENKGLTAELSKLDVITISKWFKIHQSLGLIIRDLIQSPRIGFHNNYWVNLTRLEKYILLSKKWDLNSKMQKLQAKPIKRDLAIGSN